MKKLKLNPHKYYMPEPKVFKKPSKSAPHFHGRSVLWWILCHHGLWHIIKWIVIDYFKHYRPNKEEYQKVNKEYRKWMESLKR